MKFIPTFILFSLILYNYRCVAVDEIMARTLLRAMWNANHAVIRANRAVEPDQRNRQLRNLGSNLIIMGASSIAVTISAIVQPPERIFSYPTYMKVIFSVGLGFIAVFGLSGITIGMFLLSTDNPVQYRRVAMVMMWASCVAAAFAIGVLLVASFSPA